MTTTPLELRKIRDFGENLNDTFQFIKQEFKPLLTVFAAIPGIFILLAGVFGGEFQGDYFRDLMNAMKNQADPSQLSNPTDILSLSYFLTIIFTVISFVVMRVTIAAYFKLYEQKGSVSPTVSEVWQVVLKYIFPITLYSIVLGILIVIGLILCLVPGIYYMVFFAPVNFIFVIEEVGFSAAWKRCALLLKNNFWISLGLYLVAYIIYSISSSVIGLVTSAIVGGISYLTTENIKATAAVATGILSVFQHVFYLIFAVSVGLHYYNLSEQADGLGLLRKIEDLGNQPNLHETEEQY